MTLSQLIPLLALVVTNLIAVAGIVYYMASTLGKRIDDLNANMNARFTDVNSQIGYLDKRIDDLNTNINARFSEMNANINNRIDDLRNQMQREHDNLSQKLDAHTSDHTVHQPPRV